MKADSDRLHENMERIPQFVRDLDATMKSLGACWEGPAWITFQQQVESDILNMLDLYDWLRNYLQAISGAEKIYGENEEKNYRTIEKLHI